MSLIPVVMPEGWVPPAETPASAALRAARRAEEGSMVGRRVPWLGHALLCLVAVVSLVPVLWMYLGSLHSNGQLFSPALFSPLMTLVNYHTVGLQLPVVELFWHTAAIAVLVAIAQLFTGILAAYAFANWRFPGQWVLFLLFIGTWLVPFQVTMLPNYVFLAHLNLLNSIWGVVIPQLSSAFAVLLLRQHLRAFPHELMEAARIDGLNSWSTLWRVVVPNLTPALAALGILLFVEAWNGYFWPLVVYRDLTESVLQLGLQTFLSQEATNYGALMAAAGLACIPTLALYIVLQRRVVNAFVRSGLR
jgi:ABC-type glycerol-3-phosphate transport system permease component